MRRSLFIVPVFIALISGSAALAEPRAWQVGADSFHLTGLDLSTPAGRAQALATVETAAVRLCRKTARLDRHACRAGIFATAARGPGGGGLRTAMAERAQQPTWALAQAK